MLVSSSARLTIFVRFEPAAPCHLSLSLPLSFSSSSYPYFLKTSKNEIVKKLRKTHFSNALQRGPVHNGDLSEAPVPLSFVPLSWQSQATRRIFLASMISV